MSVPLHNILLSAESLICWLDCRVIARNVQSCRCYKILFLSWITQMRKNKKKKRSCVTRLKMIIRLTLGIPQLHLLNNKKVILMIIMPVNLSLLKKDIHNIFYCFFHNRIKRYWWVFVFFGGGGLMVVLSSVGKGNFHPILVRGIMIQLSVCSQPQLKTSGSKEPWTYCSF